MVVGWQADEADAGPSPNSQTVRSVDQDLKLEPFFESD